jgi:hypothetical protein
MENKKEVSEKEILWWLFGASRYWGYDHLDYFYPVSEIAQCLGFDVKETQLEIEYMLESCKVTRIEKYDKFWYGISELSYNELTSIMEAVAFLKFVE